MNIYVVIKQDPPPPKIKGEALFKKHFNHVQKLED